PLPRPPEAEFAAALAMQTIARHPHLFNISMPFNVERMRTELTSHPNPDFVDSVLTGLLEGFWPWANTRGDGFPDTWDNAWAPPKTRAESEFVNAQRDIEIQAGRFSPSFGPDLLPGMYSTPVFAVPKPSSAKFRLVSHHSAGVFCQNAMVDRTETGGPRMDTL
ncbi:hypothetical protein CYLTODRAFT_315577, partial [Cylindrobasidium torrendii FP15055 ss-10]